MGQLLRILGIGNIGPDLDDKMAGLLKDIRRAQMASTKALGGGKGLIERNRLALKGKAAKTIPEEERTYKELMVDAARGMRDFYKGRIIRRTLTSKNPDGELVSALLPYKEMPVLVKLTAIERSKLNAITEEVSS